MLPEVVDIATEADTYSEVAEQMQFSDFTIESISDGVYWFDDQLRFIRVNSAACDALGYTAEELIGKMGKDINPEYSFEKSTEMWEETKRKGSMTFETTHIRKDGSSFPVEITNNIICWKGKELKCSIVRDISLRKEKENQLKDALGEVEALKNKFQKQNVYLREEIKLNYNFEEIIAENKKCKQLLSKLEQVAETSSTVLIVGETGTGKELLARAIHNLSDRQTNPLIKINCATLPVQLAESELFGHEKGAFTGAEAKKIGKFELAHQSSIFLDEIGDMPLEIQTKLLRVLQEGEFERLGGNETVKADVRVIAATNKNLEEAIEKGEFREDLFYRLNVFPLHPIPLRERKSDIPALTYHFVKKFEKKTNKSIETISHDTFERLAKYEWPGNIRELENIIERAMITSKEGVLDLGDWQPKQTPKREAFKLNDIERNHIVSVLEMCQGKISGPHGAAELLNINPKTLESKMKRLGIERRQSYS